ncbi:MOSC domain-containing protein [Alkalicoccus daliensis]|uniref:MOSC domain-containing protein n=1 Tax=Alkalicoccus daliensis TaxID=745820 RepID=A0A1H0GY38_9BACI|nr:MOSC N-terminal beta barrel domain-containing protein [Alkalicoccus daliensis]SDO11787.1 hypothetical protein SAMN04488053_10788 [Alkalicoccus daliensis]
MYIGKAQQIIRYPVKSMRGQQVKKIEMMPYGLYGDRSHVLIDKTRSDKFLTITQYPALLKYTAEFDGPDDKNQFPPLRITSPQGEILQWESNTLREKIETASKREVAFEAYSPEYVPFGAIEEENILIVTEASLKKLEKIYGRGEIAAARFRPNLILSLNDEEPFTEERWIGKTLSIGTEVKLKVKRTCDRCMIITVDPDTAESDPALLKTVVKERQNQFGIYCAVETSGTIHQNDEVYLLEEK